MPRPSPVTAGRCAIVEYRERRTSARDGAGMRRRDFIGLLGGAAVGWALAARAQQPAMPVIGFLGSTSPEAYVDRLRAFRQGLEEAGYVEGQNVEIEYLWAEGRTPSAFAAKAATARIPIVFGVAVDPVELGLVASLNRPDGNLTGVTNLNVKVGPKRLELLRELVPSATVIAVLVNPTSPAIAEPFVRGLQAAAPTLGLQLHLLYARTERDFDAMFATLAKLGAGALIISPDQLFFARIEQLARLTLRHAVPAISQLRQFVAAGGLMSYGSSQTEYYRPIGIYAGRILKGEKPADLPVQAPTKLELVINLKTARALGLTVPEAFLLR